MCMVPDRIMKAIIILTLFKKTEDILRNFQKVMIFLTQMWKDFKNNGTT
jgi:hypothetical protein